MSEELDNVYKERNLCVALLAQYAQMAGHKVGVRFHHGEDWEDDWRTVLFIDLPTGQVSWHFHDSERENLPNIGTYAKEWDGHTTEEKYDRVKKFIHQRKDAKEVKE